MLIISGSSFSPQFIDPGPPPPVKIIYIALIVFIFMSMWRFGALLLKRIKRKTIYSNKIDNSVAQISSILLGLTGTLFLLRSTLRAIILKGAGDINAIAGSLQEAIGPIFYGVITALSLLIIRQLAKQIKSSDIHSPTSAL